MKAVTGLLVSELFCVGVLLASCAGCQKVPSNTSWDKGNLSAIVTDDVMPDPKLKLSTTPETEVQEPEDEKDNWCSA